MTDFLVDRFDPLHIGDGVLGIVPMFGCATAHFVNERLQLITVSVHVVVKIRKGAGETMKPPTLSTQDFHNVSPCASAIDHPLAPSSQP